MSVEIPFHIWLRAEVATKPPRGINLVAEVDRRSPLTPSDAAHLVSRGCRVSVEASPHRCFPDEEFKSVGCQITEPGSWVYSDLSTVILGLRDVPQKHYALKHRHIMFCHAFKQQNGWEHRLLRFLRGDGKLYDLASIVDDNKHRLVSFGTTAGHIGMAAGILTWCKQKLEKPFPGMSIPANLLSQLNSDTPLDSHIEAILHMTTTFLSRRPRILVIGSKGRCGHGAMHFASSVGLADSLVGWTRENTAEQGPFEEILDFDIVVNAIHLDDRESGVFIDDQIIRKAKRAMSILVDISCDPVSPFNPFPIYSGTTTFEHPFLRILDGSSMSYPLDVIAIPNLPSLLPVESSKSFSSQLLIQIVSLLEDGWESNSWKNCFNAFKNAVSPLEYTSMKNVKLNSPNPFSTNFSYSAVCIPSEKCNGRTYEILEHCFSKVIASLSGNSLENMAFVIRNQIFEQSYLAGEKTVPISLFAAKERSQWHFSLLLDSLIGDQRSCSAILSVLVSLIAPEYAEYAPSPQSFVWGVGHRDYWKQQSFPKLSLKDRNDAFWKQQSALLENAANMVLPGELNRPMQNEVSSTLWRKSFSLSEIFSRTLKGDFVVMSAHILSCFAILLFRRTRDSSFKLGCIAPGRNRCQVHNSIGPFEVCCPLFVEIEPSDPFTVVFNKLKTSILHQRAHFEGVDYSADENEESVIVRLFDELYGLDPILPVSRFHGPVPLQGKAETVLSMQNGECVIVSVDMSTQIFSNEGRDEFIRQLEQLILETLLDASRGILTYSLVTENARQMGFVPDQELSLDGSWPGPISECFNRKALEVPEKDAIVYKEMSVSFSILRLAVDGLASKLIGAGIQKGDVVAIYGHRSPPIVLAIMAILRAGAAYTMMDPKYPTSRISACLDIAKPRAWIRIADPESRSTEGQQDLPRALRGYLESISDQLCFDCTLKMDSFQFFSTRSCNSKYPSIDQTDVAVVTFTSGSTGLPKGVEGCHSSLTHFYPWMGSEFGISSDDRFSMCSGIAHDPLQRDIFTPLFFGASIFIPSEFDITEPGNLSRWMKFNDISISCFTPAMGQILVTAEDSLVKLDRFRLAFFVGDLLIKRDVARLYDLAPNVVCINMYGSTETQRAVGFLKVPRCLDGCKEVIPVGVGMKDVQLLLLNDAGALAGVGEAAEIFVRSPHIAKGYLGLIEQTKARFLISEYPSCSMDRLYRTGDLGRYRPDGFGVECAGRADDQIKIRGFRIELGEINSVLSKHSAVKENVTIVLETVPGEKRIVSFFVPMESYSETDTSDMLADIRNYLKRHLPGYMIPSSLVVLDYMPLTPNGKINRKALSEISPAKKERVKPFTETQQRLENIWRNCLDLTDVGIHENFFEIGGHSLLITKLSLEISREFGRRIPMSLVSNFPSIAGLAEIIDKKEELLMQDFAPWSSSFVNDIILPEDIVPSSDFDSSLFNPVAVECILLTGSTGFVGSFLLESLLNLTNARVVCLVRAENDEKAREKLISSMSRHMLWKVDYASRVEAIASDIGNDRLGLTIEQFNSLSSSVDVIYHNGAFVHWLLPYEKLKPVNVNATVWLLRLSSASKIPIPFHYISTTSVFDSVHHQSLDRVFESDSLEHSAGLSGGYPQSKWVSEKLLMSARGRGMPVCIYRPGYISGDSRKGLWNTDDFVCRLIKGCLQLKQSPFMEYNLNSAKSPVCIDICPVDYVAGAIVRISLHDECFHHSNFNVVNPAPIPYLQIFEIVESFGFDLSHVPYNSWRTRLFQSFEKDAESNALYSVASQFTDTWMKNLHGPVYDSKNVQKVIGDDFACPDVRKLMFLYLSYFIRCGFLDAPPHASEQLHLNWKLIGDNVQRLTRSNRSKG